MLIEIVGVDILQMTSVGKFRQVGRLHPAYPQWRDVGDIANAVGHGIGGDLVGRDVPGRSPAPEGRPLGGGAVVDGVAADGRFVYQDLHQELFMGVLGGDPAQLMHGLTIYYRME